MPEISLLPPGFAVLDTDLYAAVDMTAQQNPNAAFGVTKKYTLAQLKNYLQLQVQSSNIRSTRAASVVNLIANYYNGSDGVGATLTNASIYEPLVIDSVTLSVGDRVLIAQQSDARQNGVYVVTAIGSTIAPWVLTRAGDYNGSLPFQVMQGDFVGVFSGSQNTLKFWCMISPNPIVLGTSNIYFEQQEFRQTWNVVTAASQMMIPNQGYIIQSTTLCNLVLPTSCSVGDEIRILGDNVSHYSVSQNPGQSIHQLSVSTAIGNPGYLQSLDQGCAVTLICTQENNKFRAYVMNGNFYFNE